MKTRIFIGLAVMLMTLFGITAYANENNDNPTAEANIDGLNYFLDFTTHEATITTDHTVSGELNIPSEINYKGETFVVKGMAWCSFYNNQGLAKVMIPKTVEGILNYVPHDPEDGTGGAVAPIYLNPFKGCSALESIEVDKDNPSLKSVDGVLFSQDGVGQYYYHTNNYKGTGLYCYPEGKQQHIYTIPDGVEWIGGGAVSNNKYLTTLTIPNSMKHICTSAFEGCSNLNDLYCKADNVPVVWESVFKNVLIASATLHVPEGSIEKYKATSPWKDFGSIVATASDVQSSGCLNNTRAGSNSTKESISLLKEGNILTVNLHNYWSQCATEDFEVTPSVSESNNGDPYTVSVKVKSIGENEADCICPYNISFTIHDVEANSFYFKCWWFNGQVNLTEGEQLVLSNEYYPEGTKWTEIRLDTLKYDSWYSKVGDEWVPNFETVEYAVKGTYTPKYWESPFKCVYTNSQEWTDSLTLLIYEGKDHGIDMGVLATVPVIYDDNTSPFPGEAYYFDWSVGMTVRFVDILRNNTTAIYPPDKFDFGKIEEIKEGEFGGVRPLKYTDINGVRIIQGIGVTTWNDGECLFGPVKPYQALSFFKEGFPYDERHYRSMLVHFERNGEVLYDVWPAKETVSFTKDQMATIILPTEPDASKGKYYRLDRCEKGKIIFEEELSPKARTPYIIVPKEDFSIDLNALDLDGLPRDTVSVKGASFIGSYCHEELSCQDGFYIDIIDATPDCQADDSNQRKAIVGALRACLIVNWDDPYNQGGSKGITEKREIVLKDNPNGIESLTPVAPGERGSIYDLQGRRLSEKPAKGLYIQNGVKRVVR